ncbi:hypothetical protein KCP71_21490 [Salmonella enterica subsp. enterica]|nr:hypothetical protein KCP71_21490 [Salmonella enterica subsp. enterica]
MLRPFSQQPDKPCVNVVFLGELNRSRLSRCPPVFGCRAFCACWRRRAISADYAPDRAAGEAVDQFTDLLQLVFVLRAGNAFTIR